MITYTVEIRTKEGTNKTITITCKPNQINGMTYEKYPDCQIIRIY